MSELSKQAKLNNRYTNHSVRATCITVLDSKGFEARDIMSVSSHKSEQTIKAYSKTSEGKKRKMSEALSTALVNSPPKVMKTSNEVASENSNNNNSGTTDDNLSVIRDLLELTPEQEKEFFNEILTQEIAMPQGQTNDNSANVNITTSRNIQNMPLTNRILPKMMFANSNITINFNMK